MAEETRKKILTARCNRCGRDYGEEWGRETCDFCPGQVEIIRVNNDQGTLAPDTPDSKGRIISL